MAKQNNKGKAWTSTQIQEALKLVKGNTPTRLIAHKLGRTEDAVRAKAAELKVSLKPVNRSPYNRIKKG